MKCLMIGLDGATFTLLRRFCEYRDVERGMIRPFSGRVELNIDLAGE